MSDLEARLRAIVDSDIANRSLTTDEAEEALVLLRRLGELEQVEGKVKRLLGVEHQTISLVALRMFFAEPEPTALSEAGGTDA